MKSKAFFWAVLLLPSAYLFASLWALMAGDPFPPFNDPGNWLKIGYAILGNAIPMWEQTTFQYPPLFPAILALFSAATGNELFAAKFLSSILIAAIPLAGYLLAKEVSGSRWVGLLGAWLAGFAPIFEEMFGWGGYPNELGIVFLTLAAVFTVRAARRPDRRGYAFVAVFSFLTPLAHHLTFIVMMGSLAIALVLLALLTRRPSELKAPAASAAFAALGFGFWRLLAGPFQYQLFNGASQATRPFDLSTFLWTFKSPAVVVLLFGSSAVGVLWLYRERRFTELSLLLAFSAAPFLVTQSYLIGIALDPTRFPAFAALPLGVLAAASLGWLFGPESKFSIVKAGPRLRRFEVGITPTGVVVSLALGALLVGTVFTSIATQAAVFQYYHYEVDYTYSGGQRLTAIDWIRANTSKSAVFVADTTLGRWIEGYGHRRVLMDLSPYQAFIAGEVTRYKAADLILTSNVEMANPYIKLTDGTPYRLSSTPTFWASTGTNFTSTMNLVDAYVRVGFLKAGSSWSEAPYNPVSFNMSWVQRTPNNATLAFTYVTQGLVITKVESIDLNDASAVARYDVAPKQGVQLQNLTLPVWVPFGTNVTDVQTSPTGALMTVNHVQLSMSPVGSIESVSFGTDNSTRQQRLLLTYSSTGDSIEAGFRISFPHAQKASWTSTLDAFTFDEAVSQYNVSYVAVGKNLYNMPMLLSDPRLTLAYSNEQIAIFKVVGGT